VDAVRVRAYAPGRVNLIGDHTDYTGGLVLPMAIDRGTTVVAERTGARVVLESSDDPDAAVIDLHVTDPASVTPTWARYVAGLVCVLRPEVGMVGAVRTDLPIGAGLSSSAALEVAVALALGFAGTPAETATLCQEAEQAASGVPSGLMDQLASVAGLEGHALLIDCTTLDITPVPIPEGIDVVVIDSGQHRQLATSAYAERRAECEAAAKQLGPLRQATLTAVEALTDPTLRRRARHVVTENGRVVDFARALGAGDLLEAGRLMDESHVSLREDFEVSTSVIDELVTKVASTPGVYGARMTGGGFGGCVVALADPRSPVVGWRLKASDGATVEDL
jgi:galactokinase